MSIQVNDFQWEPGKNDAEYIKLLESSRDEWQKIAQKATAKLKALSKAQEPRVMTLEELEHAEIAYAEDKDKTDIIPVLVLGRMCEHVALVKPHVDKEAITRMIIPRADDYGVHWRCWKSRPTDEQREATPWI